MDLAEPLRRLLFPFGKVREVSPMLHSRRAAWLRPLLRGTPQANLRERDAQPTAFLARTPSHQVEKAAYAPYHLHGWQYQDALRRFRHHRQVGPM